MKKYRASNPVVVAMSRRFGSVSTSHRGVRRPGDARNHWLSDVPRDDDPQDCSSLEDGDSPIPESKGHETVTSGSI